jgi:hypothetical protein
MNLRIKWKFSTKKSNADHFFTEINNLHVTATKRTITEIDMNSSGFYKFHSLLQKGQAGYLLEDRLDLSDGMVCIEVKRFEFFK